MLKDGILSNMPKCNPITKLRPPQSKILRSFCGMVNFLSSFLKDIRKYLIPIYEIEKKINKLHGWRKVKDYLNI